MSEISQIFEAMPGRYIAGKVDKTKTYYFSVGSEKWTVSMHPDRCEVARGKADADVVLKCDPKLFVKMVLHGKMPGPLDIARGKIKTNDPQALQGLMSSFRS
jgi:putative sterol carrier protein